MIEQLGKYKILSELGQGAMGTVYKGEDPLIGRIVAIKTINNTTLAGQDAEEAAARFKQEAQAAGRLNHPNIVVVYDYGEDHGSAFIAMAFVEGRELKTYFDRNEVFGLDDIVRIMDQLLDALNFAHINKIVHRDIKPGNIIVSDNGHVMITDFGIARLENSDLTQVGATMGTPNYMAPEQCMGQRIDGRADIFSAAVILYQFLTGEKPFAGANITSIMHKILKVDPVPPSELNLQIPKAFDALIAKGVAKRPEDRFATADEFRKAMHEAVKGVELNLPQPTGGNAVPPNDDETIIAPSLNSEVEDATVMVDAPHHPVAGAGKKSKIIPVLVGVVLLALVAGGLFMFAGGDKKGAAEMVSIEPVQVPVVVSENMPLVSEAGIFVETLPEKAIVMLDGKRVQGLTPLDIEVTAGHHELLVSKDGYFMVPIDVEIKEGDMVPLVISLHRQ